ncbi:tyrosine-type recombinase/integrase [Botrimarina sp.]|uniref:tyrosine-type recombinase/integrase n=1 Tax=Botrimarina sp. TaxID=2795802 RepID=UPI0032EAF64A
MASVVTETASGRKRYRVAFRDENGKRRAVRLPGVSKKDAAEIASKVQSIVSARIAGAPLSNATAEWLASLGDDLHAKLAGVGLCGPRKAATLAAFLDSLIGEWAAREGNAKPAERTVINWKAARGKLCEGLAEDMPLRDITAEHAKRWREWLSAKHAPATVAAHVKRAKQFFREAVERGYLAESPFEGLIAGDDSNAERKAYVPAADADKLLKAAPDSEWKLLIALARYGGLRTPSESLRLKWSDIDWAGGTMRVTSPKTAKQGKASRTVPLFEELLPYLRDALEAAPEGAVYCVTRYRSGEANLRTQLLRLIARAGLTPWPRLWHAMRASRATDLADRFPSHVAAAWLGHTEEIARRNYRSVTAEHLAIARGELPGRDAAKGDAGGGAQGAGNRQKSASPAAPPGTKNPEKRCVSRGSESAKVPRRGVEPLSPP